MTHPRYKRSEGGYIHDESLLEMYLIAAEHGVTDFVVPGNKADRIEFYRDSLMENTRDTPVFYAPGFVAQGGKITDAGKAAGDKWHAIVGRGIYNPNKKDNQKDVSFKEIREAAIKMTSQI